MTLFSERRSLFPNLPDGMRFHDWQKDHVTKFLYKIRAIPNDIYPIEKSGKDFLDVVVPGGGKTLFALTCAYALFKLDLIDWVVYLNPSKQLKEQVKISALRYADLNLSSYALSFDKVSEEIRLRRVRPSIQGQIITYQSLSNLENVSLLSDLCNRFNILVIADEVHHLANGASWGDNYIEAFDDASYRLALTGTPYRSKSTERIPYLNVVRDGKYERYVPDANLTRKEAVDKGIICDLLTAPIELSKEAKNYNKRQTFKMDNQELFYRVMDRAYSLWEVEQKHHKEAMMILYVSGIEDAVIAEMRIKQSYPKLKPLCIHSKTDHDSCLMLNYFSAKAKAYADQYNCLIAVDMAREGTDIKQVRVIALFTESITRVSVNQTISRASRIDADNKEGNHDSYIVYVNYPDLERYMAEFGLDTVKLRQPREGGIAPIRGDEEWIDPSVFGDAQYGSVTRMSTKESISSDVFEQYLEVAKDKDLSVELLTRGMILVQDTVTKKMRRATIEEIRDMEL